MVFILKQNAQVCPNQVLTSVTYPMANFANRNSHDEVPLAVAGQVNYTVIVKSGYHYAADIKIITDDADEIDIMTVPFSKRLLVDVVCCVVFNLIILWSQVPIMFKTVMYPLTTPPY